MALLFCAFPLAFVHFQVEAKGKQSTFERPPSSRSWRCSLFLFAFPLGIRLRHALGAGAVAAGLSLIDVLEKDAVLDVATLLDGPVGRGAIQTPVDLLGAVPAHRARPQRSLRPVRGQQGVGLGSRRVRHESNQGVVAFSLARPKGLSQSVVGPAKTGSKFATVRLTP